MRPGTARKARKPMFRTYSNVLQTALQWLFERLTPLLVLPGLVKHWSKTVYVDELSTNNLVFPENELVDVLVSEELLLRKTYTLPRAAKRSAKSVIDLKIKQSMPDSANGLVWTIGAFTRDKKQGNVEVCLMKTTHIELLKAAAIECNSKLRSVQTRDFPSATPLFDDRKTLDKPLRFWNSFVVITFILLSAAIVFIDQRQISRLQELQGTLEEEKMEVRELARAVEEKRMHAEASKQEVHNTLEAINFENNRLTYLASLTEALDDNTWLAQFNLSRDRLTISGFTTNEVTELVSFLQSEDWVRNVELEKPISFDSFSRKNRFELGISLDRKLD